MPSVFFELSWVGGCQCSLVSFLCFLANTKPNIRKNKCFTDIVFIQRCEITFPATLWTSLCGLMTIYCLMYSCKGYDMFLMHYLWALLVFLTIRFEFWNQQQVDLWSIGSSAWPWKCLSSDARGAAGLFKKKKQLCIMVFPWIPWGLEGQKLSDWEVFWGSIYSELRMLPVFYIACKMS